LIWSAIITLFRSKASLKAEILTLRLQLNGCDENRPGGARSAMRHSNIAAPMTGLGQKRPRHRFKTVSPHGWNSSKAGLELGRPPRRMVRGLSN
jgi:hypothetical protein